MTCCSVRWCGKNSRTSKYKTDGITFHRFPKEPDLKEKWIDSTKRENWFPTQYSVICSRHFTEDCFYSTKTHRHLYDSAIPTLHLPILGNTTVVSEPAPKNSDPIASSSSHFEPLSNIQMTIKREYTDHADSSELNSPTKKHPSKSILETLLTSDSTPVNATLTTSTLLYKPISTTVRANKRKASDLETPTSVKSEEHAPQNANPTASSSIQCDPLSMNKRKAIDSESLSEFDFLTKKQLCRRILQLKHKITNKNKTLKTLRDKVRRYKKKVKSLENTIEEFQIQLINIEDADI